MYVCMYVSMYEADSQRPAVLTSLLSAPAVLLKDMLPSRSKLLGKEANASKHSPPSLATSLSKDRLRLWLFNWLLFCFRLEHRFLPIVGCTD